MLTRPGCPYTLHAALKPNYNFEKRRRDLAKKQKQEEKRQRKLQQKAAGAAEPGDGPAKQDPEGNLEPQA